MEQAIFTNMCMVYDGQGNILVQNRVKSDWAGITFPGGHVERGESFVESTVREVREETGLNIWNLQLCGVKQFQTNEGARYVVMLYKTNCFSGQLTASEEGEVYWIKADKLHEYKLAPGFDEMFEVFIKEYMSECYYTKQGGELRLKLL
ncbi:MAG: 8-oxo-dGTP diphosphatase [Candidatus Niameybacter stercoravium]|nr:8-oxo-dGTP diphosphatase [Candidatus Niameybacter stercoravium]